MERTAAFARVRDCLVVTLLGETTGRSWESLRSDLLGRLGASGVRGVVIDASAVAVVDDVDGRALADTVDMCRLLGARALVAGLSVEVVTALILLDAPLDRLEGEASVERAIERLLQGADDGQP
ncbi:MAG: STAS domain-containing protein [Deltaproteobacteria bacterium]|nr:STAS domain-containing protein [Deltaproteobacteria bacterium]